MNYCTILILILHKGLLMFKKIILSTLVFLLFSACSSKQSPHECLKKPDPGLCKAYFPKYYFNVESKNCVEFIWGGCQGSVPFETLKECQQKCEK